MFSGRCVCSQKSEYTYINIYSIANSRKRRLCCDGVLVGVKVLRAEVVGMVASAGALWLAV